VVSEQGAQAEHDARLGPDLELRQVRRAELVGVAPTLRVAMDVEVAPGDIDDPDLRYLEAGVKGQLGVAVVGQAGVRDLDEEQAVLRPRVSPRIVVVASTQQGEIRLGGG
jgi:hypothetical protein